MLYCDFQPSVRACVVGGEAEGGVLCVITVYSSQKPVSVATESHSIVAKGVAETLHPLFSPAFYEYIRYRKICRQSHSAGSGIYYKICSKEVYCRFLITCGKQDYCETEYDYSFHGCVQINRNYNLLK